VRVSSIASKAPIAIVLAFPPPNAKVATVAALVAQPGQLVASRPISTWAPRLPQALEAGDRRLSRGERVALDLHVDEELHEHPHHRGPQEDKYRGRPPRPHRGHPPAGGTDLRPPRVTPRLHPPVSIENIHRAQHIAGRDDFAGQNSPVIELIEKILVPGRRDGTFTRDIDAVDLHMMISAFCVFRVANRHTFGAIFDRDLTDPALRDRYRQMLGDMVVMYLGPK
jgi:Tetracyclin repressor-like, C-terminal domain